MKSYKTIAVIGGTGKAGQYLVKELLTQNYYIKMLVRNPQHFGKDHSNITIIHGDVADAGAVLQTVEGCDAVISTLGMGVPPSSPDIFTKATANILDAMQQNGIMRYIVITGLNVNTPQDRKGPKAQMATDWMYANYPASTQNKQQEYELLAQSDAGWTMVRLPMILLTDETPETEVNTEDCPGDNISAAALARFLINQLDDAQYIRQAPFIADKR